MWQLDLQAWHAEHKLALDELAKVVTMMNQHEIASSTHDKDIATFADEVSGYEYRLAEHCSQQKSGDVGELKDALGHRHAKKKAETLGQAHERIKKHHHTAMAHVMSLKAALEAAM